MAVRLVDLSEACPAGFGDDSCGTEEDIKDLHYMLEYLRLNFDLVPKSEKWVLRGGTEKQPLFWDPKKGWVRTPFEAKKYETQASAKTALERYHGRRFQRDGVDVIRVTP